MMKEILRITDLSCGYSSGFRIEGVDFSLVEGTFAGIVGPNGSGKTTLFRGCTGDLPLRSGSVVIEGRALADLSVKERAQKVAIVSQFTEKTNITVREYVLLGRTPYRSKFQFFDTEEDIAEAEHYMRLTGTLRHRDRMMIELSGGELQMASIAMALCQRPRLLLLDEPTSHLDITHQIRFMDLVQQLNLELGLTVMMIIHDLTMAAEYCDYLVMMKQGKLFTQGTPDQVLTHQNIEEVYETPVVVGTNPVSGKKAIFPVSRQAMMNSRL